MLKALLSYMCQIDMLHVQSKLARRQGSLAKSAWHAATIPPYSSEAAGNFQGGVAVRGRDVVCAASA
jgi:hypothetical protein